MYRTTAALVASLTLAACTLPAVAPPLGSPSDQCNASAYKDLLGRSRDVFAAMSFPAPMRIIGPGDAVTMDHNPQRLNFAVDAKGIITRAFCG